MKYYKNKDYLIEKYIEKNLSDKAIGELNSVSRKAITYWRNKFFIETPESHKRAGGPPKIKIHWEERKTLSYLLGVAFGDGWVTDYHFYLEVTSKEFVKSVEKALKIVGLNSHLFWRPKHHCWRIYGSSKILAHFIKEQKKNLNFLKSSSDKWAFLRGFYESEGSYKRNDKNASCVWLSNTDIKLLRKIQAIIKSLGYKTSLYLQKRKYKYSNFEGTINLLGGTRTNIKFIKKLNPVIKREVRKNGIEINQETFTNGRNPIFRKKRGHPFNPPCTLYMD